MRHARGPARRLVLCTLAAALAAAVTAAGAAAVTAEPAAVESAPSGFLTVAEPIAGTYLVVLKGQPAGRADAQVRQQVSDEAEGTHQDFGNRADIVFDNVGDGRNGVDCHGHGTHVSGTVGGATYGVAKAVRLHTVRVLNCQGYGDDNKIAEAIDWVTANGQKPAVVNMSLGAQGTHAGMETAVKNAIAAGFVYALAGGNNNESACNFTPARTPEAITVGATERNDAKAGYSNYGTCLDIWGPGSSIVSAGHGGDTSTATMSGTSMASPHVAGAAALYLADNPSATPRQVRDALVNSATPNKVTNPVADRRTASCSSEIPPPAPPPARPHHRRLRRLRRPRRLPRRLRPRRRPDRRVTSTPMTPTFRSAPSTARR